MMKKIKEILSRILLLSLLLSCGNAFPSSSNAVNISKQILSVQEKAIENPYISYKFNYPTISNKIPENSIKVIGNHQIKLEDVVRILKNTEKSCGVISYKDGKFINGMGSAIQDQELIKKMLIINKMYLFSDRNCHYIVYIKENPYKNYMDILSTDKNTSVSRQTVEANSTFNSKQRINDIAIMKLKDLMSVHEKAKGFGGISRDIDNWDKTYFNNTKRERSVIRRERWAHSERLPIAENFKDRILRKIKKKVIVNPVKMSRQRVNLESFTGNKYFTKFGVFIEDYLSKLDDTFSLIHTKFDERMLHALCGNKVNDSSLASFIMEKHEVYDKELPLIKDILNSTERLKFTNGKLGSPMWLSGEIGKQDTINVRDECQRIRSLLFDNGFWKATGFLHVKRTQDLLKVNTVYNSGGMVKFNDIVFIGNNNFSSKKLLSIIQKQSSFVDGYNDTSASYFEFLAKLQRIRDFYINHGFTTVDFKVQFIDDPRKNKPYSVVHIHEGPYFGASDLVLHASDESGQYKEKVSDLLLNTNIPWTANLLDTLSEFNRVINSNTKRTTSINSVVVPETGFRYKNKYFSKVDCYQSEKNREVASNVAVLGQSPSIADYQIMYAHDKEFKTLPENYFLSGNKPLKARHVLSDMSVDFCRSFADRIPEYNYGQRDSIKTHNEVFHLTEVPSTGVDLRFASNLDLFPQMKYNLGFDYDSTDEEAQLSPDLKDSDTRGTGESKKIEDKKYKTSYSLRLDADSVLGSGNPFFIESSLLGKGLSFTYGETSPNYLHNTLSQIDTRESTKLNANFKHDLFAPSSMTVGRNWRTNFGEGNIWLENTAGIYYKTPADRLDYKSYLKVIDHELQDNNMFLWHSSFNYKTDPEVGEEFAFKNLSFNIEKSAFSGLGYSVSYNDILSKPVSIFSSKLTLSRTIGIGYENKNIVDNQDRVFRDGTFDFKCNGIEQAPMYMDRKPHTSDEMSQIDKISYGNKSTLKNIKENLDYTNNNLLPLVKIQAQKTHKNTSKPDYIEMQELDLLHKPDIMAVRDKKKTSYKMESKFQEYMKSLKNLRQFYSYGNKHNKFHKPIVDGERLIPMRDLEPNEKFSAPEYNLYAAMHSYDGIRKLYKLFDGDFVLFGDVGLSVPGENENLEIIPHYNRQSSGFYHNKFRNISQHLTHTSMDLVFGNHFDTRSEIQNAKIINMECSLKMDFFLNFLGYIVDASITDPLIHADKGISLKIILNNHPPKYNETYCYNSLFKFPNISQRKVNGVKVSNGMFKSIKNVDSDIKFLAEQNKIYGKKVLEDTLSDILPLDGHTGNLVDTTKDLSYERDGVSGNMTETIPTPVPFEYIPAPAQHPTEGNNSVAIQKSYAELRKAHDKMDGFLKKDNNFNTWDMVTIRDKRADKELQQNIYDLIFGQYIFNDRSSSNTSFLQGKKPVGEAMRAYYDNIANELYFVGDDGAELGDEMLHDPKTNLSAEYHQTFDDISSKEKRKVKDVINNLIEKKGEVYPLSDDDSMQYLPGIKKPVENDLIEPYGTTDTSRNSEFDKLPDIKGLGDIVKNTENDSDNSNDSTSIDSASIESGLNSDVIRSILESKNNFDKKQEEQR